MSRFGKDKTMRSHVNMSTSCRHVKISPCLWLQLVTQVPVEIWIRVKLKLKIDRSVKTLWQEYGAVAGWFHDFDLYDKNVAHCFNELITIIWGVLCRISTSNRVLRISAYTKSDSGITPIAIIFIVANQTDSCFGVIPCRTKAIETFYVAIELQRSLWTNQCLPRVTTQNVAWCCPSAINEYIESACLSMTIKLICWPIFIPRQILVKGIFQ